MTTQPTVIHRGDAAVGARLKAHDLTGAVLLEGLAFGHAHWVESTAHDPSSLRGFLMWGRTVRRLCDLLVPKGWSKRELSACPLLVHPSGSLALTVVAGNCLTGNPDQEGGQPNVRYPRGPVMRTLFPRSQTEIFNPSLFPVAPSLETWMLLHYHESNSLKAELSLPLALTDDGYVTGWRERVLLDSDAVDPLARIVPQADTPAEIDIPVHMKA